MKLTTMAMFCAAFIGSGCSFLFVNGPPAHHEQMRYFDCSSSNVIPVLDVIWAGLNGLGAANAFSKDEDEMENRNTVIAVGFMWLAVSGASAIYGFTTVADCKGAKEKLMLRSYQPMGSEAWQRDSPGGVDRAPPPPEPAGPAPPPVEVDVVEPAPEPAPTPDESESVEPTPEPTPEPERAPPEDASPEESGSADESEATDVPQ